MARAEDRSSWLPLLGSAAIFLVLLLPLVLASRGGGEVQRPHTVEPTATVETGASTGPAGPARPGDPAAGHAGH